MSRNRPYDGNEAAPQVNNEIFTELYERHRERLLQKITAVVMDRERAEDVAASAFATAFEKLGTFRGESSLYTWLCAIALNEVRNGWRKRQTVAIESFTGPVPEALIECDVAADKFERSEHDLRMRDALRHVPAIYRRALLDHLAHGYSTKQIAAREQIPLGTVLSRIFNGKRLLRRAWESVP